MNKTGRIESGMLADVIVVDRKLLEIPPIQIHETKVRTTTIDAEVVHRAAE